MSGGVNVKSVPRGPPSSGIPLPRSLLPSSPKTEPRRRASDLPKPSKQTPKHTPANTPAHSPSLCPRNSSIPGPSSTDALRDACLKSQLFQRTGALPIPQVSRSAYSSPLTQRRVHLPHSKDTLDLGKSQILSQLPQDGNRNRSTFANENQAYGAGNLRPPLSFSRGDNSNIVTQATADAIPGRKEEPPKNHPAKSVILSNCNIRPTLLYSNQHTIRDHSDSGSQSDEEMGTPEDSSPASSPLPLPLPAITFTMPVTSKQVVDTQDREATSEETHIPRVNMAAVAPFSHR